VGFSRCGETAGVEKISWIFLSVLCDFSAPSAFENYQPPTTTFAIMFVCSNPAVCAELHGKGTMPTDVVMPQMGESIFEGTITKWLKKAGDKVDAEIPAPASGILQEIKVSEGNTVQVNTVVGVIGDGDGASAKAAAPAPAAAAPPKKEAKEAPASQPAAIAPQKEKEEDEDEASDVRSSPLVRKLAREHNVDLAKVNGTGTGGRVTKQDILDFVEHRTAAPVATPAPRPAP